MIASECVCCGKMVVFLARRQRQRRSLLAIRLGPLLWWWLWLHLRHCLGEIAVVQVSWCVPDDDEDGEDGTDVVVSAQATARSHFQEQSEVVVVVVQWLPTVRQYHS